jgi:hypothetical protein
MITKIQVTQPSHIIYKGTFSTDMFNLSLAPPDEFVYDNISTDWILNPSSKDPKVFSDPDIKEWLETHKNHVRLTLQATNDNLF